MTQATWHLIGNSLFWDVHYFSGLKSVTKMSTTQRDYKPVPFCVHCCRISMYLGNLLDICAKDWLKDTFTAHS